MRNVMYRTLGICLLIASLQIPAAVGQFGHEENLFESSISYAGQTFSVPGALGMLRQTTDCFPDKAKGAVSDAEVLCHTLDGVYFTDPDAPGVQLTLYNTSLLPTSSSREVIARFTRGLDIFKKTLGGSRSSASYGDLQTSGHALGQPDMLQPVTRSSSTFAIADVRVLKVQDANTGLVYLAADQRGMFPNADLYMDYVFTLPGTSILGIYSTPVRTAQNAGAENFEAFVKARLTTTDTAAQRTQFESILETYATQFTANKPAYTALLGAVSEMLGSVKTTPFVDVFPSTPFAEAILAMRAKGIVGGYPDSTYKPTRSVNRAEFMKILIESRKPGDINAQTKACFPDVNAAEWYAKYVCYGKEKGIIDGYADGSFRPESSVNLAEALKITFKTYGINVSGGGEWYQPFLDEARRRGMLVLINAEVGDALSRGEMAELIYRLAGSL